MRVHSGPSFSRARFRRLALALAAIAHMLAIVVAPVAEAATDRTAAPHVEEAGTSQHHSHTETTCIVCAGHPLLANTAPAAYRLSVASMRLTAPAAFARHAPTPPTGTPLGSRAPPVIA